MIKENKKDLATEQVTHTYDEKYTNPNPGSNLIPIF